jgi:hypothetical protein
MCPLCWGEEDVKHILLKCKESKKWREEWINRNWPDINEDLVYKKIICCMNINRIKLLGKYLFKVKCKWENKVRGDLNPPPTPRLVGEWRGALNNINNRSRIKRNFSIV